MDNRTRPRRARGHTRPLRFAFAHDEDADEVVVVLREDDIRPAVADLRWRLDALLRNGPARIAIDLSNIGQLSSATIAVLLWVNRRCVSRGVGVVLREPTHRTVDRLDRSGLLDALAIEPLAASKRGRELSYPPRRHP